MTKTAALKGLLTGFVLLASSVTQVYAQNTPSPVQMLDPKLGPKFDDVIMSVPSPDELRGCTVELVKGSAKGASGWLLKDARGLPLRRFFDTNGDNKVDVWSYFKDGVEVYREFDTSGKGLPDNFRWLNAGGMKWGIGGVDKGRGYINSWRMISSEEVGYEAFQAIARHDYARLQVLFITEAEMQALKLPTPKTKTIQAHQQQAQKRFADVCKAVNLTGAKFDVVEGGIAQCDTTNDVEIIRYPTRQIRFQQNNKFDFLHTHEMIQVGMVWRLVDVPATGPIIDRPIGGGGDNPALDKLLQELAILDDPSKTPLPKPILANDAAIENYYRRRIPLVQKIIPLDKADQQGWYKQLFDNLMAQAQNSGDKATIGYLTQMKDDVVKQMPGSNLAAYGVYREMWTIYSLKMVNPPPGIVKNIQDRWLADLAVFVTKYSKAEDTPEALHQLAIGCEFDGKNEEAKRWYKQLYDYFPEHHLAPRARGSEARLNLVGNEMRLVAPFLADPGKGFDVAQLRGKIVIVHYWGSYTEQYKDDFVRLKRVMDSAKQDVALVCINLDDNAARARDAVNKAQAPGIHLFQASNNAAGLNSPLATQYGIHMLPTIFVVGRDGRVTNNNLQVGDIETELKKVQ